MQTHRLNADDQPFEADNEQVAENDRDPETQVWLLTGQGKDSQAQAAMCHRKRANTDKGKRVAEQANDRFEQVHKGLDEEHHTPANTASFHRSMTFHRVSERA